jgi:hypothetical protein
MTLFIGSICFIGGVAAGFWIMSALTKRWLSSSKFEQLVKAEVEKAFDAGYLSAAHCVSSAGHGELAGQLRRAVQAANDN